MAHARSGHTRPAGLQEGSSDESFAGAVRIDLALQGERQERRWLCALGVAFPSDSVRGATCQIELLFVQGHVRRREAFLTSGSCGDVFDL